MYPHTLPWLTNESPFPPVEQAWPASSEAPGLLAAGADLRIERLLTAYRHGIFPWFSEGQPILWWSTDPRMVLETDAFRMHKSFARTLRRFMADEHCEIRVDHNFDNVMHQCAGATRVGQRGTWIVAPMQRAYSDMHRAGFAHSVETWMNGQLVGGLYCVSIGKAVFGESMFSLRSDASKIALAALVALCRSQGVPLIDCQQQTSHLHSLGARPVPRATFLTHVASAHHEPALEWVWNPLYWNALVPSRPSTNV